MLRFQNLWIALFLFCLSCSQFSKSVMISDKKWTSISTVNSGKTMIDTMNFDSKHSMLFCDFFPIADSINRCEFLVDFEFVADSAFGSQTQLGDTVRLTCDYGKVKTLGTLHSIMINVYGTINGIDMLMYTGDSTIFVSSDSINQYIIPLKWDGSYFLKPSNHMMKALVSVSDTVLIKGEAVNSKFIQ